MIVLPEKQKFTFCCPPAQKHGSVCVAPSRFPASASAAAAAGSEKVTEVSGNNSPVSRVSTSFSPSEVTTRAGMVGPRWHTSQTLVKTCRLLQEREQSPCVIMGKHLHWASVVEGVCARTHVCLYKSMASDLSKITDCINNNIQQAEYKPQNRLGLLELNESSTAGIAFSSAGVERVLTFTSTHKHTEKQTIF